MIGFASIGKARSAVKTAAGLGALVTLLWLGLCGWYIGKYYGWQSFGAMLPHEVATVVAGIFAPPLLVWLVALFFARANTVQEETRELLRHLQAMTYPPDEADEKVARIAAVRTSAWPLSASAMRATFSSASSGG